MAAGATAHALARSVLGRWGATGTELQAVLPGDEFVAEPATQQTMAITISATPEQVWPWLVQMGVDRAGLYSYTLVENGLFHLGVTNADRIHPEWQDLKIGDTVAFIPANYPGGRRGPEVIMLERNRALILDLTSTVSGGQTLSTWQFVLERLSDDATRLLLRSRAGKNQPIAARLFNALLDPGYLIMNRAMLLGIKERAERRLHEPDPSIFATQETPNATCADPALRPHLTGRFRDRHAAA